MARLLDSWVKENTRRDGSKFYTVHIKLRGFLWIPYKESLNCIYEQFFWISDSSMFNSPYEYDTEAEARGDLKEHTKRMIEASEKKRQSQVVSSKRLKP